MLDTSSSYFIDMGGIAISPPFFVMNLTSLKIEKKQEKEKLKSQSLKIAKNHTEYYKIIPVLICQNRNFCISLENPIVKDAENSIDKQLCVLCAEGLLSGLGVLYCFHRNGRTEGRKDDED